MAIVYRHIRIDKNEPFYIGKGKSLYRAYSKFGRNSHWQNIVNKTDYRVEIMFDNLTMEQAAEKEIEFIKLYGRIGFGGSLCNLTDGGDGKEGFFCSEQTKIKISESNKGKVRSKKVREAMSVRLKGTTLSEDVRLKMVKSRTGLKRSEETKLKMSKSRKGKRLSDETRLKMSESKKGRKLSDETRRKMSESQRGKKMSNDSIIKMRVSQSNRSDEHRRKISENKKNYWARKKAKL